MTRTELALRVLLIAGIGLGGGAALYVMAAYPAAAGLAIALAVFSAFLAGPLVGRGT